MSDSLPAPAMRAAARTKIFQPAEMVVGGATSRVHLLDLSRIGALAYADTAPAVGAIIRLRCASALGLARVAWASGKRFGVAFLTPLTPHQFDEVVVPLASLATSSARLSPARVPATAR